MFAKFKNYVSNSKESPSIDSNLNKRNWFDDRYYSLIIQRNILFLLLVVSILTVVFSIFGISYIATSKQFEPFVIEIQKDTGTTTIVNPASSDLLDGNDALARYFIKEYVTARETYNPVDFTQRSRTIIKLMSSPDIYYQYLGYIRDDANNPALLYGNTNTTYIKTKSWSSLPDGSFVYRFSINETTGVRKTYNKIAIISFKYQPTELLEDDRDINPVGFTVTGYRVDNDES